MEPSGHAAADESLDFDYQLLDHAMSDEDIFGHGGGLDQSEGEELGERKRRKIHDVADRAGADVADATSGDGGCVARLNDCSDEIGRDPTASGSQAGGDGGRKEACRQRRSASDEVKWPRDELRRCVRESIGEAGSGEKR